MTTRQPTNKKTVKGRPLKERLAELSPLHRELLQRRLNVSQSRSTTSITSQLSELISQAKCVDANQGTTLAPAQQRIWFFEKLQPDAGAYNLNQLYRLKGAVNFDAMQSAFIKVIERQAALRTYFSEKEGQPLQIVEDAVEFKLQQVDLATVPLFRREAELNELIDQEVEAPFDLSCAPLVRATLVNLDLNEYALIIVLHHIIADAWGLGVLVNELEKFYQAEVSGRVVDLAELPFTYPDVVNWQARVEQTERLKKQLDFWYQALQGTTGLLNLPTDKPRPNELSLRGARHRLELDENNYSSLMRLVQAEGITTFMLLLSTFQVLLARHSGQSDIIVGTPVANRNETDFQSLVGLFVNTLALRAHISSELSFRELLAETKRHCLDAFSHAEAPLEKMIDQLKLERVPGRTPLFQTMFVLLNGEEKLPDFEDVVVDTLKCDSRIARFEMTLSMTDNGSKLSGVIDYNRDLFDEATIVRLGEQFNHLLNVVAANPDCQLKQLSILPEQQRSELIAIGTGPDIQPDQKIKPYCLHQLLINQADLTPDAIAVVQPGLELTYQQLQKRVYGVAYELLKRNVLAETRVGVFADRSINSLIAILGVLAAGGVYVPLDPIHPGERLDYILDDAEIKILITPAAMLKQAQGLQQRAGLTDNCLLIGENIGTHEFAPISLTNTDNTAYIIYTSGSTGKPKGVAISHRNAMNLVEGFVLNHNFDEQRLLMIPPLFFDASVGDIFPILAVGSTLVIHPNPGELSALALNRFCHEFSVTAIDAPVALWRRWTEGFLSQKNMSVLPGIQLLMFGGESVPIEQVKCFAKMTENRITLCNHYGPTEASVCASLLSTINAKEFNGSELPIGKPLPGVNIYILDKHLNLLPKGAVGELCIGGKGVAQGYLGAKELTREKFVTDPFSMNRAGILYRTGDLARWNNDDTLDFLGRTDHQVKLRGFRIELGEVESAISSYPGVHSAVAKLCELTPGEKTLVAYFIAEKTVQQNDIRDYLSAQLPDAMLPGIFYPMAHFPLTNNGKVDRRALPKPESQIIVERQLRLPVTETEKGILKVWSELLKRHDISTDDEFFNIGGDSLMTLTLVYKLQTLFSVEVPVTAIFSSPTIIGLAEVVDQLIAGTFENELDLESKLVLADDIHPKQAKPRRTKRSQPDSILITGATGFLGAYLLREMLDTTGAEIHCLVRAKDNQHGLQRVLENMKNYQLLKATDIERIKVIRGNLTLPLLGLSEYEFAELASNVDLIFHNGGQVNFLAPYENLEAANVQGTIEVLRLATTDYVKPVHLVSTLGVFLCEEYLNTTVLESSSPPAGSSQYGGYNQSKWVGEQLALIARERGLPVAIYRPARITGDSRTGSSNLGDYFNSWIKGCVQLGAMPYLPGQTFDMAPVDYVAAAIVKLALGAGDENANFHFLNSHRMTAKSMYAALCEAGVDVALVSYQEWREKLLRSIGRSNDNALAIFASLFPENPGVAEPDFNCSATEQAVEKYGIYCPPADRVLFRTYLRFMLEQGFLPEAQTMEVY